MASGDLPPVLVPSSDATGLAAVGSANPAVLGRLTGASTDLAAATSMATEPLGKLPEGMEAPEAAAWTVVSNVLLNLDEVFNRR